MDLKKKFLQNIHSSIQTNNIAELKALLSAYSYYDLDDNDFYLVCLAYHKVSDYITSNKLILEKSKIINDVKLKRKFIRLEIFNLFFLFRYDEIKSKIKLSLHFSYDPEIIRIYYLICKNVNDYTNFLKDIKKNISQNKPTVENSSVLINFMTNNAEYKLLGFLLLRIFKFNKNNKFILEQLAVNYFLQKKYFLSKKYYKKLLFYSTSSDIFLNLAIISNYLRENKECENYLNSSLHKNPNNFKAIDLQISLKSNIISETYISDLLKKEETVPGSPTLEYLQYALARVFEVKKNYKNSYKYFSKANRIKDTITFNVDKIVKESDFFINYFGKAEKSLSNDLLDTNKIPIFIVGLPRSGTTLVEHILGAHPLVQHFGETNYFYKNFKFLFNVYELDKNETIFSNYKTEDYLNFGRLYLSYFNLVKGKTYFTDKMPFNFYYLGLIKRVLPNSKIIITKRDYRDTAISILKNNFGLDMNFAYNEKKVFDYIKNYHRTIKSWKEILQNNLFEIDYENLINDPDNNVRSLLKFVNLDYNPLCLNFYKKKLSSDTVSTNQVTKNFYDSSVGSWKNFYDFSPNFFDSLKDIK